MTRILVTAEGFLSLGDTRFPCRLGKAGTILDKHEGDGATPIGEWPIRRVLFRPDRVEAPPTALAVTPIAPDDGWCDDPGHPDYNRAVKLPHPASCESLWRDDGLYDVVVVLGHNDSPPVPGKGSAIFLHVAKPDGSPTRGCVALSLADLLAVLRQCAPGDSLTVCA